VFDYSRGRLNAITRVFLSKLKFTAFNLYQWHIAYLLPSSKFTCPGIYEPDSCRVNSVVRSACDCE